MRKLASLRTAWLVAALIAGVLLVDGGYRLSTYVDPQVAYYDLGIKAYQAGDMAKAVRYFDMSIASYKAAQRDTWMHRFINPRPSLELAAMANFQKGKALLQAKQAEQAVEAFKESLRLNPGDLRGGLSADQALRLHEEAMVVKYDLELLFKSRPDLAAGQGKGQGQGQQGQGQGQQQGKQAPGQNPGSLPGKGRPDDI